MQFNENNNCLEICIEDETLNFCPSSYNPLTNIKIPKNVDFSLKVNSTSLFKISTFRRSFPGILRLDLLEAVDVEFEIGTSVLQLVLLGAEFCKIGLQLLTCSAKSCTGKNSEQFLHIVLTLLTLIIFVVSGTGWLTVS